MSTLGEDYPVEQARCRELLDEYRAIGPRGIFAYMTISDVLRRADEAAISGDVVAMIRAYKEMKDCK